MQTLSIVQFTCVLQRDTILECEVETQMFASFILFKYTFL